MPRRTRHRRARVAGIAAMLLGWGLTVAAVAPHEVALLINAASPDSIRVAQAYADGRGIPAPNRIRVTVPDQYLAPVAAMPADAFTRHIWQPACRILAERKLMEQVTVWIYSVDFPLRIDGDPPLSLTGLTFLRNRWPDPDAARDGRYASPLYGGPDPGSGAFRPPAGLAVQFERLDDPPLPAALLGYSGPGGNSVETVLRGLREGLGVDGRRPDGTVYFVTADDIRSRVRQWQFEPAARELGMHGVRAVVSNDFPAGKRDVLGIMTGMPDPRPETVGRFVTGAFAEHLTSFSAVYEIPEQTKMTAWTDAGATASAGVVSEPRAYWTKFPSARFFVYYAAGCTYLESFYQAVRCPLQTVPIGDPLMRPFGPAARVVFEAGDNRDDSIIRAQVEAPDAAAWQQYAIWVNHRRVRDGNDGRLELDLRDLALPAGDHTVRIAVWRPDQIRPSLWAETVRETVHGVTPHEN